MCGTVTVYVLDGVQVEILYILTLDYCKLLVILIGMRQHRISVIAHQHFVQLPLYY